MGIGRYHSITTFAFQRSKKKKKTITNNRNCDAMVK